MKGEDMRGERTMKRRLEDKWMVWRRTVDVNQEVGP